MTFRTGVLDDQSSQDSRAYIHGSSGFDQSVRSYEPKSGVCDNRSGGGDKSLFDKGPADYGAIRAESAAAAHTARLIEGYEAHSATLLTRIDLIGCL